MPAVVLCLQLGMVLFWDLDCPVESRSRYLVVLQALVWDIGVLGLVQPLVALFVALVVCPIMSLTVATGQLLYTLSSVLNQLLSNQNILFCVCTKEHNQIVSSLTTLLFYPKYNTLITITCSKTLKTLPTLAEKLD